MTARLLPPVLLVSALVACTGPTGGSAFYNGIGNPHAAEVRQEVLTLDLITSGGGLAPGEADRAADWLAANSFGYGDRVALDDGTGSGGEGVRRDVSVLVGRYGLVLSDAVPVTPGAVPPGTTRLVVLRAQAVVDGCPDWGSSAIIPQKRLGNHGCASASNLAAMIADPNDLLTGKSAPDTGSAAATAVKAINAQRAAAGTSAGGTEVKNISGGGN